MAIFKKAIIIQLIFELIFVIVITLLFRYKDLYTYLSYDEGVHAYIGQVAIFSLKFPYSDVFDQKPPLVYLPYIIARLIFGFGPFYVRLFGFLLSLITSFLLLRLLKIKFNYTVAIVAVILEAIFANHPLQDGIFNLLSEQQIKFYIVVYLYWSNSKKLSNSWSFFIDGFLISLISLTKQTYIIAIFLPLIEIITIHLKTKNIKGILKKMLATSIGFIIPWLSFTLLYLANNSFYQFILGTWLYGFKFYLNQHPPLNEWILLLYSRLSWFKPLFWVIILLPSLYGLLIETKITGWQHYHIRNASYE